MQTEPQSNQQPTNRNEALVEWYPMVERIAHRAAASYGLPASVDASDLVSCGVLGLAEAWDRFDPERGIAFEAFAIPRIKGAVIDAIRAADWVPRKARQRARETGEQLAVLVSMDEDHGSESGERMSTADRMADEQLPEPGTELMESEDKRELIGTLNRLPERERMIVTLHYFEGVALQEIAKSLGVTESRVSQLHTRALRMMREGIEASELDVASAA
jgi:RNA polymerase sigma factor for flagellar operon FliA